jgi:acyl carrier protein
LVVALDKNYGFKIADSAAAKELLASVSSLASGLAQHQAAKAIGA